MAIDWKNPQSMILGIVTLFLVVELSKVGFPLLISSFVDLGGLQNFTFGAFFTGSLMPLILSAAILFAVLKIFGVGSSKR